ncbi:YheC/YheD family protein [Salinithrix halophila]|uniref:YheC/YheD family protein n=1 Tax=Salinithrix halophila TaxID=1485204 RepID=A0ABV8JLC2_9BACL
MNLANYPGISARQRWIPAVTNKLGNAMLLSGHPFTRAHVPLTRMLNQQQLEIFLACFPLVYLKPLFGCRGKGIWRIDRLSGGEYLLRARKRKRTYRPKSQRELWRVLRSLLGKRTYVIQQGIRSETRSGRPFDIRVHLVRIDGKWREAGIVGKVARRNSIVTNRHSGGIPKPAIHLFRNDLGYSRSQTDQILKDLERISVQATRVISRCHPKWWEFGVDAGVDSRGKVWIYEINITPGGMVFRDADQKVFYRMLRLRRIAKKQAERR